MYHIDIMTLFPDVVGDMLCESVLGRGQERGYIRVDCHQIRDYTINKQKQVDDYPYGGGRGAVIQADPLYRCWDYICQQAGERVHTIYMSPAGKTFTQTEARRLKDSYSRLILVCGHYEGIDERFIEECVDEEISLGDFVMTGGEIPALAVADAVCRLVPGVLSDPSCYENESHWNGRLPNTPAQRCGMAERCRPSFCLATTPRWTSGAESSLFFAPGNAGPISMKNWTCLRKRIKSCCGSWKRSEEHAGRCRE